MLPATSSPRLVSRCPREHIHPLQSFPTCERTIWLPLSLERVCLPSYLDPKCLGGGWSCKEVLVTVLALAREKQSQHWAGHPWEVLPKTNTGPQACGWAEEHPQEAPGSQQHLSLPWVGLTSLCHVGKPRASVRLLCRKAAASPGAVRKRMG